MKYTSDLNFLCTLTTFSVKNRKIPTFYILFSLLEKSHFTFFASHAPPEKEELNSSSTGPLLLPWRNSS